MSKSAKTVFVIINILYFGFNFVVIPFLPCPIFFGWLSLPMLCLFGSAFVGSIIWFIYYHAFFKTQKDI